MAGVGTSTGNAALESEVLLRRAASIGREEFFARSDTSLPPAVDAAYSTLIARRAAGVPVTYLVGHREFFGLDLTVDARVMIPRPETECLVEAVTGMFRRPDPLVVDIGTGSGAIAIAVARILPAARVLATDIAAEALDLARLNAKRCGVGDRIVWEMGPGLDPLQRCLVEGQVDALVCNPPYIPSAEVAALPPEVREWEPHIALDGGPDGLCVHRPVIAGAGRYGRPGGVLALEVAALWDQACTVSRLIAATGAFATARIIRDHAGAERVVVAERITGDGDHRD